MSAALASALKDARRTCECGHVHFAVICPICKTPTPEYERVLGIGAADRFPPHPPSSAPSVRLDKPRPSPLFQLVQNGLAATGFAVLALGSMGWWARADLITWYQGLPIGIVALHCPKS